MNDNPIVTVKLTNAKLGKGDGPDVRVKIQVGNGPVIERIGAGSQDKWLFQAPCTSSPLNVHVDVREVDPKYTDENSSDCDLAVDLTAPQNRTKSDSDTASLEVDAVGGDKGKTANFDFSLKWFVSSNIADVIDYIQGEMLNNLKSSTFKKIQAEHKANGHLVDPAKRLLALYNFAELVGYGKAWDHKKAIKQQWGTWALDASRGKQYRFDIWSNIHYGYIGKAIGFGADTLLDAAGVAQALHNQEWLKVAKAITFQTGRELDDPEDQVAIAIGITLWNKYGNGVTAEQLLNSVRGVASRLATQDALEGKPPTSFVNKQ